MKNSIYLSTLILVFSLESRAANLIADPGFEDFAPGTNLDTTNQYQASLLSRWGVDSSIVTTTENGITPVEGSQMARANIGAWTDMLTLIDLTPYSAAVNSGSATVDLSASFNSVNPGDFFLTLGTLSGSLPQDLTNRLNIVTSPTFSTDSLTATWQSQSLTSYAIAPGSDYLVVGVHNVFDNSNPSYFDNTSLTITVPEPSGILLSLCGLGVLGLRRHR